MSLKKDLVKRLREKLKENHQSMDSGLDPVPYNRKVGENEALRDTLDWLSENSSPDDAGDELEDLDT